MGRTRNFGGDTVRFNQGIVVSGSSSDNGGFSLVGSGSAWFNSLSGSLTHLSDGTSYLVAGSNITLTSASNGSITIASSGGGGGGISFDGSTANGVLTYKDSDEATVESNMTFDGNTLTVSGDVDGSYVAIIDNDQSSNGHGLKVTSDGTGTGTNILALEAASTTIFKVRGDGRVGIGVDTPGSTLSVDDEIAVGEKLIHRGDPNTYLEFPANDELNLVAGGKSVFKFDGTAILLNNSNQNYNTQIMADNGNVALHVDAADVKVGIGETNPSYKLDVNGNIGLNEYIYHRDDANTFIRFQDDEINIECGGRQMIQCLESSNDKVCINNNGVDIDFQVKGTSSENNLLRVTAGNNRVGIKTDTPDYELDVAGNIGLDEYIYHNGDADTFVRFETNNISLSAGGAAMTYDGTDLTVPGASSIYVDKIRRASDSSTTTKILLNDEAIKFYADHSSDNICTIDSTGLKIDNGSLETATIDYTDGDLSMTIADGGKVTFAAGFDVGSDAAGDILYHNGTSYVRLAKGSADQVLTMNDAATAPNWEDASGGGSSNEYYHLTLSGRVRNTNGSLHGHAAYPYNAGDADWTTSLSSYVSNWTTGDSSFDATYVNGMLYFTVGVAAAAMALTSAQIAYYMAADDMTDDYIWEVWKATPTSGTAYSTSLSWSRIGQIDRGGDPSSATYYAASNTFSSGNTLAAGDLIGLTVHNPGDTYTSKYHGYHLTLRFTYS